MDDINKNISSYQLDQEILDARGINMTVEDVAGLPTVKYSEKVHSLNLNDDDMAFLKGLRRRIKNRLASQNSRRRSMEQLRQLSRELRAVRACKGDALSERRELVTQKNSLVTTCRSLREYMEKILKERDDKTPIPNVDLQLEIKQEMESQHEKDSLQNFKEKQDRLEKRLQKRLEQLETQNLGLHCKMPENVEFPKSVEWPKSVECPKSVDSPKSLEWPKSVDCSKSVECPKSVEKLNLGEQKKVIAKTVFIDTQNSALKNGVKDDNCVLNLSLKENGRRSHGRKQSAPRRIAYAFTDFDYQDSVLDLKIKKENQ